MDNSRKQSLGTYLRLVSPTRISRVGLDERLSNGQSAQDLLREVVEVAITHNPPDHTVIIDCIALLSEKGARVATGKPGHCDFERLINRLAPIAMDIIPLLAKIPGELPFHVYARHCPDVISPPKLCNPDFRAALLASDDQGLTVSHCLWDEHGFLAMKDRVEGDPLAWRTVVKRAWKTQELIVRYGFSMEIPDNEGRTALDLCADRVSAGEIPLFPEFDICKKVESRILQRDLMTNTSQAEAPTTRPGRRL